MSNPDVRALIERLALAMVSQRSALEAADYDRLASLLPECEAAFDAMMDCPGGAEGVRQQLNELAWADRTDLMDMIERANLDYQVARGLVNVAMQRSAAMQGFQASQSEGATYSEHGAVSHATGSLVSRKV